MCHFVDVNENEEVFTLPYVEMLRRCEEAERKMQFVIAQCATHEVPLQKIREVG